MAVTSGRHGRHARGHWLPKDRHGKYLQAKDAGSVGQGSAWEAQTKAAEMAFMGRFVVTPQNGRSSSELLLCMEIGEGSRREARHPLMGTYGDWWAREVH